MITEITGYFAARGVEVEVFDLNNPPAWFCGQDPERCSECGSLLEEDGRCPVCDEEGAWDTDLEEDQADIDWESEDSWLDGEW